MKNPTIDEILQSIYMGYVYPTFDAFGNVNGNLSCDIGNGSILQWLKLAEDFVASAAKSDKAFDIDKGMEGMVLKKKNHCGTLFYDLCGHLRGLSNPPQHEMSEEAKILSDNAIKLGLHLANFTGNPLSIISAGVLEGDLINSLVTRTRESLKRPRYKKHLQARKKEVTQNIIRTTRYFNRLSVNHPNLYVVRIYFGYQLEHASGITLVDTNEHLIKFVEAFNTGLANGFQVGWWCKRGYMTEVGYSYHFILLFDGQKTPSHNNFVNDLGSQWNSVVGDKGTFVTSVYDVHNHKTWATGFLQQGYLSNLENLLLSIKLMLMQDIYLKLHNGDKFPHINMGSLPKLLASPASYMQSALDIQKLLNV
ncbi:MAG: hypothetical protein WAT12_16005 [Candidatus Nitrotoga sp.]